MKHMGWDLPGQTAPWRTYASGDFRTADATHRKLYIYEEGPASQS